MAGQRRGEPDGGPGRGRPRRGGLALALSLLLTLLPACSDGGPTGIDRPGGSRGTSGQETATARLAGVWQTSALVEVPGDIQAWTTTWRFEPDGECFQTVETASLAEGVSRVSERTCTFVARDVDLTVTFASGGTLVLEYSFADFSPNRLILDGFEYQRVD